ncbi:MAG TPA: hypothetical protein VMC78_09025, partial [Mycobacterium sp.]|nr:hypothetical protein [Mycobacterium sp.]
KPVQCEFESHRGHSLPQVRRYEARNTNGVERLLNQSVEVGGDDDFDPNSLHQIRDGLVRSGGLFPSCFTDQPPSP